MATYTTNLGLKKPAGSENMNVADINGNSDDIDAAITSDRNAIAIVSKGNTHAAIILGQYVYVYSHGTLPDGLYKATANVSANGTLSTSNLSSVSFGGLNDIIGSLSESVNTTNVTEVINFDTETRFYVYFNGSSSTGTKPTTTTTNGHLITFVRDSDRTAVQFVRHQSNSDSKIYMRLNNAGTWGAWTIFTPNLGEGDITSNETITITLRGNICMVHLSRINQSKSVLLGFDYWSSGYSVLGGTEPSGVTITKSSSSNTFTIKNNNNYVIAYRVL